MWNLEREGVRRLLNHGGRCGGNERDSTGAESSKDDLGDQGLIRADQYMSQGQVLEESHVRAMVRCLRAHYNGPKLSLGRLI